MRMNGWEHDCCENFATDADLPVVGSKSNIFGSTSASRVPNQQPFTFKP